jgi:hypothetical protein
MVTTINVSIFPISLNHYCKCIFATILNNYCWRIFVTILNNYCYCIFATISNNYFGKSLFLLLVYEQLV